MPKAKPVTTSDLPPAEKAQLLVKIKQKSRVHTTTGCWERRQGYANFMKFKGRNVAVHRLACALEHGDVLAGQCVMHGCDNQCCVNPAHLTAGTQQENMADMWAKGRGVPGTGPKPVEWHNPDVHQYPDPNPDRRIPIQFTNPARGTVRVTNTTPRRSAMRIEIIQGGQVLRQYNHEGQSYIEAPPAGDYEIRLTNQSPKRKLVVLSVDGVNVVDGETAGYEGPGYVLSGWQTAHIKGWRRTDAEVAAFAFNASSKSYAAKTGRGTKNTGVIGIAVYDEKAKPAPSWTQTVTTSTTTETFGHPISSRGHDGFASMDSMDLERDSGIDSFDDDDDGISQVYCASAAPAAESADLGTSYSANAGTLNTKGLQPETAKAQSAGDRLRFHPESARGGVMRRRRVTKGAPSLGTGYGKQTAMHTSTTEFERASEQPSLVVVLRYAVAAKLREWGVPVIERSPSADAFPASSGPSVAAPPGWRG